MIITQYWPDPLLQGDSSKFKAENASYQIWPSPYPMLNVSATGDGGHVTYALTGLPADAHLTMSCVYANATPDTRLYALKSDFQQLTESTTFSGDYGGVDMSFTVPSDGIVRIRFFVGRGGNATFSGFVVCDSDKIGKLRELVGRDATPNNDKHAVWGDLMPLA